MAEPNPVNAGAGRGTSGDVVRDQDKIMLVLAYLGLFALIPYLTVKDSEYVKWHAKQGLALFLCWLGWFVGTMILGFVPILGIVIGIVGCLGHVAVLVLMIFCIVKALEPNRWTIPFVSQVADKL